ncbi:MAG TPA: DUF2254 domain-containing protein [Pyrinomonadaceae bacterium]|jgi:uncharacterized membrane protein
MNWLWLYRTRLYIGNSIWIFPALSLVAGLVAVSILWRFEEAYGWEMNVTHETAMAIMGTIASSMFSLVVLVSSALLVAVQLAGGQLTPRIVTIIYRNPHRKLALSMFAFTFTFSMGVLVRLETRVPWLTGYLAAYGFILNLALFLYFVDSVGKTLRPGTVLQTVALYGREVIHSVYPRRITENPCVPQNFRYNREEKPHRSIVSLEDGAVLAFDLKGLYTLAELSNCLIELVPEVGDYVAAGDVVFRLYHGGETISAEALRNSVALGPERTMEQDPMFAFRIIVDIASRALSPAINDPTTAVLAIDQLHHLLREAGNCYLAQGQETNGVGRVRLIYSVPKWEDFVHLAVTEIRHYGSDSIQVMRRLRAMLENLEETLPIMRAAVLQKELQLLENSVKRTFPDLEDQVLAETSDLQGMGGNRNENHHLEHSIGADAADFVTSVTNHE